MTNADKFKGIFGVYATELWAKPEKEFLEWLNDDVPDTNDGETISRQAAIDAVFNLDVTNRVSWKDAVIDTIDALPPALPERKKAKWVKMTGMMPPEYIGHYECSECGWHLSHHDKTKENELRFCPQCGLEMLKGEDDGQDV